MKKIISALVCICFLVSFASAQKGYDDLTREMTENTDEIIKEISSYNVAFDDMFKVISTNASRITMATIGSVVVCFFIFFFIYVRSRKHFTRLVTQVIIQQNVKLVADITIENSRYIKEIEGLMGHTQRLQVQEFTPLDSYIEEALPELNKEDNEEPDESTNSLSRASIANGMGSNAPDLPKTLLKRMDKSKSKKGADKPIARRKSKKEKRIEAEAVMKVAEGNVKKKPTLQELDQEVAILETLPKDFRAIPKRPKSNSIFAKFKNAFKGKPKVAKEKYIVEPPIKSQVDKKDGPKSKDKSSKVVKKPKGRSPKVVKTQKIVKNISKASKKQKLPLPKKKKKKPGAMGKFFKLMKSSPNELIGKGGKDGIT